MIYKNGPEILQVDLVSTCNAQCHFCFRQDSLGHPQPHYPKNVHLDQDLLMNGLKDPAFQNLQEVLFCGNFGDALASPHLLTIIDAIISLRPEMGINIHTNGSLGSKQLWQELSLRLRGQGRFVKFAIDGLHDTNKIYRKGVEWEKVLENAETFIRGGGRAIWKFVVFDHNKHQIVEAQKLSQRLGFARFITVPNYFPEGESRLFSESYPPSAQAQYEVTPENRKQIQIDCKVCQTSSVFLDFDGRLWPCCWIAGWKYSSEAAKRRFHQKHFESMDESFNSLHHHTASEILNHPWFQKNLPQSWEFTSSFPLHYECLSTCGKSN
ncbi:radical SAM protein [Bdellovibrio sp. HCB2-146]|uniref:radical SAM protein n=1 Tax=Bdellovibrio sp. HCB2-146 TaxID=3394362 RepID=UPI0039BD540A